jgi:hypothetical protein
MTTRNVSAAALIALLAVCGWPAAAGAVGYRASASQVAGARGTTRAVVVTPFAGPSAAQTGAVVRPARGGRHTKFVLELTARQTLGRGGDARADYRVTLSGPDGACSDEFTIASATAGAHLREALHAPTRAGWCRGRYTGVVILDRGPSCPPLQSAAQPVACPDYVIAPVTVGRFGFTVT